MVERIIARFILRCDPGWGTSSRGRTTSDRKGMDSMGSHITLASSDGHRLGAYRADPAGPARGGVVVLQEIFGVNHHIRAVCDPLAAAGYSAVAPALFDRQARDYESGYSPEEVAEASKFLSNMDWAAPMNAPAAAVPVLPNRKGVR